MENKKSKNILIASLNRDSLVLSKILDTLLPDLVLLWDTEKYAKKHEFDIKSGKTLELYKESLDTECLSEIILNDQFENPNMLRNEIHHFLKKVSNIQDYQVILDVTAGRSLTASVITVIALEIKEVFQAQVFISYCDYESNKLKILNPLEKELCLNDKKICLSFPLKSLENRMAINNYYVNNFGSYETYYEKGVSTLEEVKSNRLKKLNEHMKDEQIRILFNSTNEMLTDWIILNKLQEKDFDFNFKNRLKTIIKNECSVHFDVKRFPNSLNYITTTILTHLDRAISFEEINIDIQILLTAVRNGEYEFAMDTIKKNTSNRIADELRNLLKKEDKYVKPMVKNLFNKIYFKSLEEVNLLSLYVNKELVTPNPPMIYLEEWCLDYFTKTMNNASLSYLFSSDEKFQKLSLILEDIVSYKILDTIMNNSDVKHFVSGIYAGVKIGKDPLLHTIEIDTLILLKNGNFLNYEVKQHYSSAPIKELDARIENAKEILGPKTVFRIIFPISKEDIENKITKNSNEWQNSLNNYSRMKKEYSVLYFDQIEETLRSDILRGQ